MKPFGVTNHYSRIYTPNADAVSNESFRAGAEFIASNTLDAVRSVMTCQPDYLVLGMSAVTFFDGEKGADRFTRQVEKTAGIKISIGSLTHAPQPCGPTAASNGSLCCHPTGLR